MKNNGIFLRRVVAELKAEMSNILRLRDEYRDFLLKYKTMDQYLIRSKASFLADFYMASERIFEIIATEIDGGIPKGDDWHKRLLWNMSIEIEGIRPSVISPDLYQNLQRFLGFRHVVRQAYGFQLDESKLSALASSFEATVDLFKKEIDLFCDKLVKMI